MTPAATRAPKMAAESADHYVTDIVFRPGYAVGLAYLRNPRGQLEEAAGVLREALPGVDVRVDPNVDYLLLRLPESALRQVNEYTGRNKMARHEALVMLVKSGLAAALHRIEADGVRLRDGKAAVVDRARSLVWMLAQMRGMVETQALERRESDDDARKRHVRRYPDDAVEAMLIIGWEPMTASEWQQRYCTTGPARF